MPGTRDSSNVSDEGVVASTGLQRLLETRDFDELAHAFRHWDARFQQLGRGAFRGSLQLVQTGAVQLIRVKTNRIIQARGFMKPGCYAFTIVTAANEEARWRGQRLRSGQLNVNRPDEVIDHVSSAMYESLGLLIDADALRERAKLLCGMDVVEQLTQTNILNIGQRASHSLESFFRRLLDQNRMGPTIAASSQQRQSAEQTCINQLLQALCCALPGSREPPQLLNRLTLVHRVEDFMLAHLQEPLLMEQLCQEVDVSERTLRYAFQDVFGLSPMAYFKTKKLNAVRQELKTGALNLASVHEIAQRWGFDHTGNLAADYRRLFGELPSQTLGQ